MLKWLTIACFFSILFNTAEINADPQKSGFRILHVMSYHAFWKWNREQFQGFKSVFAGLDVEYKVVELDTKRNSNPVEIEKKVEQAKRIIDEWNPHLIYANDDNAQKYLIQDYVGSDYPIVFSAVNRDPSEYNFVGADNVTGVMEYEHIVPTIRLLRQLVPDVKRISVIVDADPTWKGVMGRMRSSVRQIPDVEITDWTLVQTLQQFQDKVMQLQDRVDAIAMLGVFNIKDENGEDVDYEKIQRWVVENSNLPDFSFWQTRVERGTLCAVAVSGYQQGFMAGKMAKKILLDGVSPREIPIQTRTEGVPMINLMRARELGIKPNVNLLLSIDAITDYTWEH
ncbi:ABC transporter substrate-binding protein [Candidatus Thiodiazotropha sp. CDECU1]|uniref:ABC transporter substrate-binding protein n=1 Tax=Candidatus Thiodiazotropha sp. CDECU1 TaxID=3065865 RepID=UPI00292E3D6A|nr:ABC transporter substrate binding protein [Candidatus Thiodiazotropha sp. CDECU1]